LNDRHSYGKKLHTFQQSTGAKKHKTATKNLSINFVDMKIFYKKINNLIEIEKISLHQIYNRSSACKHSWRIGLILEQPHLTRVLGLNV